MSRVTKLRTVGPVLALLVAGLLPVPAADCTCPVIMELDGWCGAHAIGYVAGLEIQTYLLFEALDAHGHEVDLDSFQCPTCQRAIAQQGFCEEHRIGFVSGLAYYSRLTYLVARARATGGSAAPCPECGEIAAAGGWCDACGGAGFAGPVRFHDRRDYEEVVRALDLVHRADERGARCAHCAVAMVTDSLCPICKIEYRNGEAHPFVPRGTAGGTGAGQPRQRATDN